MKVKSQLTTSEDTVNQQESQNSNGSWRATFKFFDKNGNGFINCDELKSAMHKLGFDCSDDAISQILSNLNLNSQAEIGYNDFLRVINTQDGSFNTLSRSEINTMYAALDIDRSGGLTAAEVRHFMTKLNIDMDDNEMSEMIMMYDLDGNNQISCKEFERILVQMGYEIVEDEPDVENEIVKEPETVSSVQKSNIKDDEVEEVEEDTRVIKLDDLPSNDLLDALKEFDYSGKGEVSISDMKRAAELMKTCSNRLDDNDDNLHWDKQREKRGLGKYIKKANHIAIIVSDVGRSTTFYANVVGLQQIRRPNFDKHGAWFTAGNIELHLIKGKPLVHVDDDLIVGHLSIETDNIAKVPETLNRLGVPFRQNVSVPKGGKTGNKKGGTNVDKDSENMVRQYFFRDPDGYYLEVCNCDVLTKFCLGKTSELAGYDESVKPLTMQTAALSINLMHKWSNMSRSQLRDRKSLLQRVQNTDGSAKQIASLLGCVGAKEVDKKVLSNFLARQSVYGDICQNETVESLEEMLRLSGNVAEQANQIMHLRAAYHGKREFVPPGFYEQGKKFVKPSSIAMSYGQ